MEIRTDIPEDKFNIEEILAEMHIMWKDRFYDLYDIYDMENVLQDAGSCEALLILEKLKDDLDDYMFQETKLYAHSKIDIDYDTYHVSEIEIGPIITGFHIYPPDKEYRVQLEDRHYISGE